MCWNPTSKLADSGEISGIYISFEELCWAVEALYAGPLRVKLYRLLTCPHVDFDWPFHFRFHHRLLWSSLLIFSIRSIFSTTIRFSFLPCHSLAFLAFIFVFLSGLRNRVLMVVEPAAGEHVLTWTMLSNWLTQRKSEIVIVSQTLQHVWNSVFGHVISFFPDITNLNKSYQCWPLGVTVIVIMPRFCSSKLQHLSIYLSHLRLYLTYSTLDCTVVGLDSGI